MKVGPRPTSTGERRSFFMRPPEYIASCCTIYIAAPRAQSLLSQQNRYALRYLECRPPEYIHCTATRDIFRRPHEETSALSGTTCIIIAESAKQIALVSEPVSRKGQAAAAARTLIAILVMLPLYLEYLPLC